MSIKWVDHPPKESGFYFALVQPKMTCQSPYRSVFYVYTDVNFGDMRVIHMDEFTPVTDSKFLKWSERIPAPEGA